MNEEKLLSAPNLHRYIQFIDSHFEEISVIGRGGSAEVTHVRHILSGKHFACKRINRDENMKRQRNQLIEFEQEVTVLKRISHHHTVNFVASVTDYASFSIILTPVAKDVLKAMFERQSREQPLPQSDIATLRHAFGCLATALAYLHEQEVRHKDIKPGNILLSEGRVYLCDFGISRDWSKSENSTTEGDVMKFTRRYCAPEVFNQESRNTKSDIWSLGCVYMEMISVIKGYTIEELNEFFLQRSDGRSSQGLWSAPEIINAWLVKLRNDTPDSADNIPLDWVTPMIRIESADRPKASEIVNMIHQQCVHLETPGLFIARCCARSDSVAPVDTVVDSPTLCGPPSSGLGIGGDFTSPQGYPMAPQHRKSKDRSVSPHTQSSGPRESVDTMFYTMERTQRGYRSSSNILSPVSAVSNSDQTSSILTSGGPSRTVSHTDMITTTPPHRRPIPPPATYELKCACGPRANEKHIFNSSYSPNGSALFDRNNRTMEVFPMCEIGDNKIQVYETAPQDPKAQSRPNPMLWWVTRRLVISYISGDPEMRRCNSFWVPLADLRFAMTDNVVQLSWSDCNHMVEISTGNYQQHYDWIYEPNKPNNAIAIPFNDSVDAKQFISAITLPFNDDRYVTHTKHIPISNIFEIDVFDVGRPGVRNYRAATLKSFSTSGIATSKSYIVWPEIDLRIENTYAKEPNVSYEMNVEIKNINTPTYLSNTVGEPAADYKKVAQFSQARQIMTSMNVRFPVFPHHRFPTPPPAAVEMLQSLTGWTLSYFAIVTKFKSKNRRWGSKRFGRADVMLWEKEVDDHVANIKRRGVTVAFRLHADTRLPWITGKIGALTTVEYTSSLDATITVSNKMHGKLLHAGRMMAIESEMPSEHKHSRSGSHSDAAELSDLVVTFEDTRYRWEFVKLVEEYRLAATPLQRIHTSSESMRRIGSLASSNDPISSPPMR
ncbi:kinase-like protein [Periconia macrospinosa]|uniref:Kinase-like protein n=1 Tax=Periconia macrospinosa TaxID=97972 RepID=A0A2V1E4B7_9PLEO|nr:kinase-like protein [Periconia macrospinosa]